MNARDQAIAQMLMGMQQQINGILRLLAPEQEAPSAQVEDDRPEPRRFGQKPGGSDGKE